MVEFGNISLKFYLCTVDELIFILLILCFIQIVFYCSIVELMWPTHFFNKRHNIDWQVLKWRTYTEFFLKLRTSVSGLKMLNTVLFKYFKF